MKHLEMESPKATKEQRFANEAHDSNAVFPVPSN